ncbi:hypothetical protein ACU40O_09965 [Staphylococcus arlettae]
MSKTKEDLLIDKIKELQNEYENSQYMTKTNLEYQIYNYFNDVYLKM